MKPPTVAPVLLVLLGVAGSVAPAAAGSLALPAFPLPAAEPTEPSLWFTPADLPALIARKTDPDYSGYYATFKGLVDGRLATLATAPASLTDDTLSMVAKGAAMLHQLGDIPPGSFATYADAAVAALLGIRSRSPQILFPPADPIDILQDSSRLQSMVEGYDLVRGTGAVTAAADTAIRARLAQWANALRDDVNLVGLPPIVVGHRDNWGIKAGAALTTACLGLSAHANAASWRSFALTLLNESLARVASDTGWYRESPHYVNYSLANLASAAYHIRGRTAVDWFAPLQPLVQFALDVRQPDGAMAPFEEGIPNVFPHDVLAGAYLPLGPQMTWAWTMSARDPVNYDNQQLHSVTRFIVVDAAIAPVAPAGSPTRFIGGDANIAVLRSEWSSDARQLTLIAAKDHDNTTTFDSRHHMQNPLDLVVAGLGEILLPTASGGPEVTSSANRTTYLRPDAKNIPLVDGTAPFVTDETLLASSNRLDSADASGLTNRYADTATASVRAYPGTDRVSRTVAMLDDSFFVVADALLAPGVHDHTLVWRGRGTRTVVTDTPTLAEVEWNYATLALDLATVATTPLSLTMRDSLYARAWGREETIEVADVTVTAATTRVLTVLRPRDGATARTTVTTLSDATVAALRVDAGVAADTVVHGPPGTPYTVDRAGSDARLSAVRETAATVTAFALVEGTTLTWSSAALVVASAPTTLAVTLSDGRFLASLGIDAPLSIDYTFADLPAVDLTRAWYGYLDGARLDASQFSQTATGFRFTGITGQSLWIEPTGRPFLSAVGNTLRMVGDTLTWAPTPGAVEYKVRRSNGKDFMTTNPVPDDTFLLATATATTATDTAAPASGELAYYFVNASDGVGAESSY